MGEASKIEWTDHTFNPWIGCTPISGACDHCYAESLAKRYGWAKWGHGEPRRMTSASTWKQPRKWDRDAKAASVRRKVFCASLADIFDAEVPDDWRVLLMEKILETPNLDWLLLTKRPQVAKKFFDAMPAPRNVWLGTTVEDQKMAELRVPILLSIPGITVRFLSMEPLLGAVDLDHILVKKSDAPERGKPDVTFSALRGWYGGAGDPARLDWVIAGGESGPRARPAHPDWFRALRDQCAAAGVPYFLKQWGEWTPGENVARNSGTVPTATWWDGKWSFDRENLANEEGHVDDQPDLYRVGKKAAGAMLDGRMHREFPT